MLTIVLVLFQKIWHAVKKSRRRKNVIFCGRFTCDYRGLQHKKSIKNVAPSMPSSYARSKSVSFQNKTKTWCILNAISLSTMLLFSETWWTWQMPHCTEVQNGQFSSGGGMLTQLQWYHSDIQKFGLPKYEIKDN